MLEVIQATENHIQLRYRISFAFRRTTKKIPKRRVYSDNIYNSRSDRNLFIEVKEKQADKKNADLFLILHKQHADKIYTVLIQTKGI